MTKQTNHVEDYFLGNANMKNFMNLAYQNAFFDIKFYPKYFLDLNN